jgi:2-oxoglutarate ferredoxin oxidoreductase subunit delta
MNVFGRAPIDLQTVRIPQGQVYIVPERCKECGLCIRFCPKDVLRVSRQANSKGYYLPEVAPGREKACVHCQFCSLLCPEFAIFTHEVVI